MFFLLKGDPGLWPVVACLFGIASSTIHGDTAGLYRCHNTYSGRILLGLFAISWITNLTMYLWNLYQFTNLRQLKARVPKILTILV